MRTNAWEREVEAPSRAAFEALLERLRASGVELVSSRDDAQFAAFEDDVFGGFLERSVDITAYEMIWPYAKYAERHGELLVQRVHDRLAEARRMSAEDYARLLADETRMKARARERMGAADGILTLTASGPAPVAQSHTGSRAYQVFATFLGLPAFSLPLMYVDGMPLGAQLIGHAGRDGELCALARWLMSPQ